MVSVKMYERMAFDHIIKRDLAAAGFLLGGNNDFSIFNEFIFNGAISLADGRSGAT